MVAAYPALVEFLEILRKNTNEYFAKHYHRDDPVILLVVPTFTAHVGRKYFKIVTDNGTQRSVHCFVDARGNVYKAAGWTAPAKGVRYNLFNADDMLKLRTVDGHHSGYLYR